MLAAWAAPRLEVGAPRQVHTALVASGPTVLIPTEWAAVGDGACSSPLYRRRRCLSRQGSFQRRSRLWRESVVPVSRCLYPLSPSPHTFRKESEKVE
jgi:hypothetical protein